MSAYSTKKTVYKDRDCLVAALNDQGYKTVEVHDVAQHLIGYHGDRRPEIANVIVRREHICSAANDIGWVKNTDGTYSEIISAFDSRKHNATWLTSLKDRYSEHLNIKTAKGLGAHLLRRTVVGGKVQLEFVVK